MRARRGGRAKDDPRRFFVRQHCSASRRSATKRCKKCRVESVAALRHIRDIGRSPAHWRCGILGGGQRPARRACNDARAVNHAERELKGGCMQYRAMGSTGMEVSALGMGTMRLPLREGGQGYTSSRGADVERSVELIRHAIDSGITYFDTAFNYLHGESEKIIGKALQDGYRERALIATKSPIWMIEGEDDFDRLLRKQLDRLQTDYIDVYLLHSVMEKDWPPPRGREPARRERGRPGQAHRLLVPRPHGPVPGSDRLRRLGRVPAAAELPRPRLPGRTRGRAARSG